MQINPKVPSEDWKVPGPAKPIGGSGKPQPLPPADPSVDPFKPPIDILPKLPGGEPARPVMPCIGLEYRPDPVSEIEQIRTSKGGEQAQELMEFPGKLEVMDNEQLDKAEAYLKAQIAKPYNNDDDLLKALLKAVYQEQSASHRHIRLHPFPPQPPEPFKRPKFDGPVAD